MHKPGSHEPVTNEPVMLVHMWQVQFAQEPSCGCL